MKGKILCSCGCGKDLDKQFKQDVGLLEAEIGELTSSSGARCKAYNKKMGGVDGSSHTYGKAIDISCTSDADRFKLIKSAIKLGFCRIGIRKDFVHLDKDGSKNNNRIWVY